MLFAVLTLTEKLRPRVVAGGARRRRNGRHDRRPKGRLRRRGRSEQSGPTAARIAARVQQQEVESRVLENK